jgi:hypothetical protein
LHQLYPTSTWIAVDVGYIRWRGPAGVGLLVGALAPPRLLLQPLDGGELVHVGGVVEPHLHPDEGLPTLDAQHVPRLRLGQQLGDRALGTRENIV